jgi:hypothetical protein
MADAASGKCLGVYKALYAYASTGEDEVDMEEDQLVLLLERSDDECADFPSVFYSSAHIYLL